MGKNVENRYDSISCFLRHIQDRPAGEEASFILFEKMIDLLKREVPDFSSCLRNGQVEEKSFIALAESILHWNDEADTAISIAIKLGWQPYLESRLTRQTIQEKHGRPLLDYALRPCYQEIRNPDLWIVKKILEEGASPDEITGRGKPIPIWAHFLESMQLIKHVDYTACLNTVTALLEQGIWTRVTQRELLSTFSDLAQNTMETDKKSCLRQEQTLITTTSLCQKALIFVPGHLELIKSSAKDPTTNLPLYSPTEVLRSLISLASDRVALPLFQEADIAKFERIQRTWKGAARGCKRQGKYSSNNDCQGNVTVHMEDSEQSSRPRKKAKPSAKRCAKIS